MKTNFSVIALVSILVVGAFLGSGRRIEAVPHMVMDSPTPSPAPGPTGPEGIPLPCNPCPESPAIPPQN